MPKIVADKIDWVKIGFKLFARQGASGIVVDKIAAKLKCNRSSFYWHFSSKEKFIDQIIHYWISIDTQQIVEQVEKKGTTQEQFRTLIKLAFKTDPNIDFIFHLKRYAFKRKDLERLIDEVDEQRIHFVAALLEKAGYTNNEAMVKSQIFYKYLIGYHEMIKYKKQSKDYVEEIYLELKHFIKI